MMIIPQNPTYAYVGAFIDELARAGVRDVVICPGSRSTPLTLTFAAEERIHKWVLVDERSAAFFALGIAKRSGIPVALVCTSGTAAANFFPAICEAKASRVPLIVMTADRPPELQEVGAPQTMGQKYLYGEHVKWFTEMPLPEATDTLLRYARFTASRAVATANSVPQGPIHLNFPFREPLTTTTSAEALRPTLPLAERNQLPPQYKVTLSERDSIFLTPQAYQTLLQAQRGLIVVGDLGYGAYYPSIQEKLSEVATRFGFPVLADPMANLRGGTNSTSAIIAHYDAFLRDEGWIESYVPDLVIRLGAMPTSKPLLKYLEAHPDIPLWLVEEGESFRDPTHRATLIIDASPVAFTSIVEKYAIVRETLEPSRTWFAAWKGANEATYSILEKEISNFDERFEGRIFTELANLLPDNSSLVIGNSMPIRDCDTFLPATKSNLFVFGNRGVNGIDGQVSTALGIRASSTHSIFDPVVLVVGDLTFYHDLNGLLAAKKYGLNLTIVVINNDGGGIFSFLPQAEHHPDHFEDYFGTPTGLDFSLVTAMYGGTFTRIEHWEQFRESVTRGITEGGLHVVEVPTNRESNVVMHRHLWKKVSEALKELHSA